MKKILETQRLFLREMTRDDLLALSRILQDEATMWAYEHAFSRREVLEWLRRQRQRYREDGFGLWAVCLRKGGAMVGQCGVTWQEWEGRRVPEIGYLFARDFWHRGYATEAAVACRAYAFKVLGFDEIFSIIRDSNIASMNVAIRGGMLARGRLVKYYYGMEMPHLVFSVRKGR